MNLEAQYEYPLSRSVGSLRWDRHHAPYSGGGSEGARGSHKRRAMND